MTRIDGQCGRGFSSIGAVFVALDATTATPARFGSERSGGQILFGVA